jgi:hypothetical protein
MSHLYINKVDFIDGNKDAFGRLRTSSPYTLNDYYLHKSVDTQFLSNTSNGGTVTINTARSSANLSTNNATNAVAIHQSKMYHNYMPGKSQLTMTSFNLHGNTENVTKRVGYFDSNNGIFLEQTGDGTLNWVIRSNVSGSPQERRVAQENWNIDTCDGSGKSGFNLDTSNTQLSFIDFQWLGVGTVRCGFAHDGDYVIAHEFYNSNNLESVYMRNPDLPVRYEVRNTGTTAGANLEQICATVISEGGYVEAGRDWAAQSNAKTLATGTTLPVFAIRLKNTFDGQPNHAIVRINLAEVFTTAENVKYKVLKLPDASYLSFGANTWTSVSNNSVVEYINEAYAYTDGQEILNGFASAVSQNEQKSSAGPSNVQLGPEARRNYITQNYDSSNSEIYVLIATNLGALSTNVFAGFSWREVF